MPNKNHLYKKVLNTAPFGTVFFAYGVCIDANAQALSILKCDRSQVIGTAIGEDQDHQPQAIQQLKQVIKKLQENIEVKKELLLLQERKCQEMQEIALEICKMQKEIMTIEMQRVEASSV